MSLYESSVLVLGLGFNAFGNVTGLKNCSNFIYNSLDITIPDNLCSGHEYFVLNPIPLVELRIDLSDTQSLSDFITVSPCWDNTVVSAKDPGSGNSVILSSGKLYHATLTTLGSTTNPVGKNLKFLQLPTNKKADKGIVCEGKLHICDQSGNVTGKPLLDHVTVIDCESEENIYTIRNEEKINSVELVHVDQELSVQKSTVPFPLPGENIVHVACGNNHSLFLGATGNVYSSGIGSRGQLGHGDLGTHKSPQLIEALAGVPIASVAAGGWHSLALSFCSDIYTWGWDCSGQLGHYRLSSNSDNSSKDRAAEVVAVPTLLDSEESKHCNFVGISAGSRHSVAVSSDGGVWGWGWSAYGQLGTVSPCVARPSVISLDSHTLPQFVPRTVHCGPWNTFIVLTRDVNQWNKHQF